MRNNTIFKVLTWIDTVLNSDFLEAKSWNLATITLGGWCGRRADRLGRLPFRRFPLFQNTEYLFCRTSLSRVIDQKVVLYLSISARFAIWADRNQIGWLILIFWNETNEKSDLGLKLMLFLKVWHISIHFDISKRYPTFPLEFWSYGSKIKCASVLAKHQNKNFKKMLFDLFDYPFSSWQLLDDPYSSVQLLAASISFF